MMQEDMDRSSQQIYYCYCCKERRNVNVMLIKHKEGFDKSITCVHCNSGFIEQVVDEEGFEPAKEVYYENPKITKQKENEQANPVVNGDRSFTRTVRLRFNHPYVRNVLVNVFPLAFRRVSLERIHNIRNILNTLNMINFDDDSGLNPVDNDYLKKLKRIPYSQTDCSEKFPNCPICTDKFNKDDPVIPLVCNHVYHEECIIPWLKLHNTCPNCRKTLTN